MPRPKGSPNKITAEIKERLSQVIGISSSFNSATSNPRKLIKSILQPEFFYLF